MAKLKKNVPCNELIDKEPFPVNVNLPLSQVFTDAAFDSDLICHQPITGIIFNYCGGAIVYYSKTQTLPAGNSTKDEFIAAVTTAKLTWYLCSVLKQLKREQKEPTPIYVDNLSALKIINNNISPTKKTQLMDIYFFQIQDWRIEGDIIITIVILGLQHPNNAANQHWGPF